VPLISAHRGGCGVDGLGAAERYRRAIELSVDYVEFDVRRSLDGVMVLAHDELTPSGRPVNQLTHADLKDELGAEALTLDELLDITARRVGLHLDLKETGYEAEVVTTVLARSPLDRLVITSDDAAVGAIKETFPQVRAGLSLGEDLEGASPWITAEVRLSELFPRRRLQRCHADFVAVHRRLAQLNVLRYCEREGFQAWVWTVDEEPDIARFLPDPRVATLITDRPDIALRLRSG
jgi:glycerophosphoryl diester phosphodiesterase